LGSFVPHPAVSSLQATWVPWQLAARTESAVSNEVVPPQVATIAVPYVAGVHW